MTTSGRQNPDELRCRELPLPLYRLSYNDIFGGEGKAVYIYGFLSPESDW